jgi:hypothetical protein
MQTFPKEVQEGLAAQMADPVKYRIALDAFHAVHGCTVKPVPAEVVTSFDAIFPSAVIRL